MNNNNPPLTYETLEKWAITKLDKLTGFSSNEIVKYILSMDTNSEVETYLLELLDTTAKSKSFIADLIKRINTLPRRVTTNKFQKVVTPPVNNKKVNIKSNSNNTTTTTSTASKQKGSKTQISSFSEIELSMRPGQECDCQATKHKLITNCLNCGKIICEQEGKGPCKFCGTALFTNPASLSNEQKNLNDKNLSNAIQYKDRILGYQNTSAKRTIVYDDQEDYFSNKNNKWISEDERKQVEQQELEYRLKLDEEKRKTKITFDFVGRRIVSTAFDPNSINLDKVKFESNSNNKNSIDITNNYSENVNAIGKKGDSDSSSNSSQFKYNSNVKLKKPHNHLNNNNSNIKMDFSNSLITKQYYGVEDDLIVIKSKEEDSKSKHSVSLLKYKGIMEGIWCNFNSNKRLPNKIIYFKYLEMLSEKNCNYFVMSAESYYTCTEQDILKPSNSIPKDVLTFIKLFNSEAKKLNITINLSLTLPIDFVFGDDDSVKIIRNRIEFLQKETQVQEFTLVLPSGFNHTFTLPICAPNSTKSEVNNAKTYSMTQTGFIQKLLEKNSTIKNLIIVPSFFEMNLSTVPPTRQQIEYWLEISKSIPSNCPILFTTIEGSLQNQTLQKVKSIFEKRDLIILEKYPYKGGINHKEHKVSWNPYETYFTETQLLSGILASPFDREILLDNLTSVISISTFIQYLQLPSNYQSELSLRATLLEITSNEDISEIFSNLILTCSEGLIETIKLVLENNKQQLETNVSTPLSQKKIDHRQKVILEELKENSIMLLNYFKPSNPKDSIIQQFEFILNTINEYFQSFELNLK